MEPLPVGFKLYSNVDNNQTKSLVNNIETIANCPMIKYATSIMINGLNLTLGHKVYDFGCGAGKDTQAITDGIGEMGEYTGIDLSDAMISHAKSKFRDITNAKFIVKSADDTELPTSSCDISKCERLLQHVQQPEKVINEMVRVTKNGGLINITDTDWDSSTLCCGNDDQMKDIAKRVFQATFNCHKDMGINIKRYMIMNGNIKDIVVKPFLFTITNLLQADAVYSLKGRCELAVQQSLITPEEFIYFRQTLEKMDRAGYFFFTLNYYIVNGKVNKE